jgi:hypothetical protein
MSTYTGLDCEMKESSDETKKYTVSCHFAGLTKEQRDNAYTILKGEKDLIDAARRIEKEKQCRGPF